MCLIEAKTGILESPDDAVGGDGGAAGMKSEGIQATVAMMETMRTMLGTEPKEGPISCASYVSC